MIPKRENKRKESVKKAMRKLFFALNPGDIMRHQLAKLNRDLTDFGKAVPLQNLHMTLLFIGPTSESRLDCLLKAASAIRSAAFDMTLSRPGVFRNGMFWIGCDTNPEALLVLHQQLKAIAGHCGITTENRTYIPHVTLRRKIESVKQGEALSRELNPLVLQGIHWPVDSFSLVESNPGERASVYSELARWPLHDPFKEPLNQGL